jgi:hypothetical protein
LKRRSGYREVKKAEDSGGFFIFRDLQQLVLHNFTRSAYTLTTLISNRNKFAQLLEGLGMKLAYSLANFFITYTITQTNVHNHSRSIYAQSLNENSYDYNSTAMFVCRDDGKNANKYDASQRTDSKKGALAPFSIQN